MVTEMLMQDISAEFVTICHELIKQLCNNFGYGVLVLLWIELGPLKSNQVTRNHSKELEPVLKRIDI